MAAIADGLTFDLPNFVGDLYKVTPADTPFVTMIGGLTGGDTIFAKEHTWQTVDNAAAAQPNTVEGDEPSYAERARAEVKNVVQIYQYGYQVSYTKRASWGQLGSGGATPATPATGVLGNQPVRDELSFQTMLKLERLARDYEYTALQGVFVDPNNNSTARRTRGIITATTTNAVAAGSTALSVAHVDSVLKQMADSGAPFRNPVIFTNSFQKQQFSKLYGYAPESRNVGGVNINQIETDFAVLGIVYNRFMPTDTVLVADLSVCVPKHLAIPEKGLVFAEPMGKTHAAERWQLYAELGLEYGPELWHGKITGLTTS